MYTHHTDHLNRTQVHLYTLIKCCAQINVYHFSYRRLKCAVLQKYFKHFHPLPR